jgi:uncharacterized protein (UPF0335 family)
MAERARGRKAAMAKGEGKRGGRKGGKPGPILLSSVPDEVYRRWASKIEAAQAKYDRAADQAKTLKGELASVYKAAEQDGCDIDGMKAFYKAEKQDLDVLRRQMQTQVRMAGLKESKQLTLFEGLDLRAPPPVNPYLAGQQAGREAGDIADCPYEPGTEDFDLWQQGYRSGQERNMDQFRERQGEAASAQ